MTRSCSQLFELGLLFLLLIILQNRSWSANPRVQIRSPKDGSQITHEQDYVLVSGKMFPEGAGAGYVDIFLVLDVSGSTAHYAGVDFTEFSQLPNFYVRSRWFAGVYSGCSIRPGPHNLRISILAAEIIASRRILSQLNPETTRVGVITFSDDARVRQPLTHDFEQVRAALDLIYKRGPYGGTNMVDAIRLAAQELLGKGESEKYLDSIKTVVFLTDGFPTLPSGDCRSGNQSDTDLTINTARLAGRAGIKFHVFALGEQAMSHPRAAVGIAQESGGSYTPVIRPADVLGVLDRVSVVGVEFIQVTNETIGQRAFQSRLAPDGFFASAVPVVEGLNRIQVLARASDGSVGRDTITVHYQPGGIRSLDLEVFLEREKAFELEVERLEKSLKLEVDRLGKSPAQIQGDAE